MTSPQKKAEPYFQAVDLAFDALDRIFQSEGIWVKQHNLIYDVVNQHLEGLRQAFECWRSAVWFTDRFRIDLDDSGLPVYQHILQLQNDFNRRREMLDELPDREQIKNEMAELLLKYKQFPDSLQKTMGERLYFEAMDNQEIYKPFTPPVTVKHSYNPRSKRPFYVVHWASYDGSANLPVVYVAVIEDSSDEAPKPQKKRTGPWGETGGDEWLGQGLPNRTLSDAFRFFAQENSQYSLTLTSIATSMDRDFPTLHPKQLRRFVLGPLYVGGVTRHNEKVQGLLDSVRNDDDNWVLTWTLQELFSKEEVSSKKGIWGSAVPKEIYHINTDDIDCARNGVSAQEKHALIPHVAYQKAYAQGRVDEIFDGYQCYIASGSQIIRHV